MVCSAVLEYRTGGESGRWRSEWSLLAISVSRESRELGSLLGQGAESDSEANQYHLNGTKSVGVKMYSTLPHNIRVGYDTSQR